MYKTQRRTMLDYTSAVWLGVGAALPKGLLPTSRIKVDELKT